jgi:hypothetical protein
VAIGFGANLEQGVVILLLFLIAYDFMLLLKIYKITTQHWFLIISHIIVIFDFLYILLCPGNRLRAVSEEATWFPEFGTLTVIRKCELGMSSTLYHFIFNIEPIFLIFSCCLMLIVFEIEKGIVFRTFAIIPFFINISFTVFKSDLYALFPIFTYFDNIMSNIGIWDQNNPISIVCWLLMIVVIISIIFALCVICKRYLKVGVCSFISIVLGFASRCMMGFSPTIWVSSDRTYIFIYFSFIIAIVYLLDVMENKNIRNTIISISTVLALLSGSYLWLCI